MKDSIQAATIVPVALRTDLFLLDGDSVPLVIVAPGPSFEKIRLQTMNKNIVYDYPVLVAFVVKGNRDLSINLKDFLDTRETIRNQLYQIKVSGITGWDTNMKTESVSKFAAVVGSNYRVTGWEMIYSVAEVRQGS